MKTWKKTLPWLAVSMQHDQEAVEELLLKELESVVKADAISIMIDEKSQYELLELH